MEVAKMKIELHQKIDSVDGVKEWDLLTEIQKQHVLTGLNQAHAGQGNLLSDINTRLKSKYGVNG